MGQIVINVSSTGAIETLLKEDVLDLSKFGVREVKRITIIEFDTAAQRFFIRWLAGPYAGAIHDASMDEHCLGDDFLGLSEDQYATFDTYADAVAHEIKCVNALRLKGVSFA